MTPVESSRGRARPGPGRVPSRAARGIAGLLVVALSVGAASGQDVEEVVRGFAIGRWIIAPSLLAGVAYDTNVLRRNPLFVPRPDAEFVSTLSPEISAALPFRNSRVLFEYSGTWSEFSETQFEKNWAQDYGARAELDFASGTAARVGFGRTDGIAETLKFDPGGEVVFEGNGYTLDIASASLDRTVVGQRGFYAELVHEKLEFDPGTVPSFFNFNGYRWEATYREPTTPRTWIEATYTGRRFDQFLANRPDLGGGPFRRERADTVWGGFAGELGHRGSFRARSGWTALRFEATGGQGFTGLLLDGSADLAIGGGGRLKIAASRQALPSFLEPNNYYLSTAVSLGLERNSAVGTVLGARVAVSRSRYDEPVLANETPLLRRDRLASAEVYATVPLRRYFGLRVSAQHQERQSNDRSARFRQSVIFGGIWFGWLS